MIVVVVLFHCLHSAAHCTCENVTPDSDAAVLLVTALFIAYRVPCYLKPHSGAALRCSCVVNYIPQHGEGPFLW